MKNTHSNHFVLRANEVLVHARSDGSPDPARGLAPWPADADADVVIDRFRLFPGDADETVVVAPDAPPPDGFAWTTFRSVLAALVDEKAWAPVARALALAEWRRSNRFCGRCGTANVDKPDETARACPICDAVAYPRISPAVLAVVYRGDRILLARNGRFKGGIASLLAGFAEPGESL